MAARNLAPSERAAISLKNLHRARNDEFVPTDSGTSNLDAAAANTLVVTIRAV